MYKENVFAGKVCRKESALPWKECRKRAYARDKHTKTENGYNFAKLRNYFAIILGVFSS